ncbi:MAG: cupin fold metalloprotein, WbuC family [Rhodocyclales bacterium]|jgi:cupin fold WbuC family metalloprotein|nr:WbuC family cupin fold metalloprotein [Rhodocyclaceae bacterium]PWB39957.1 MAG: cupin fold metalloprotein, WbuC family [Rhodocyclales bacterium]
MSFFIDSAMLDALGAEAKQSLRLRKNRNFHAHESAASHRLLNALEPGSYLQPHRHLDATKDESILILRGVLGAVFFDESGAVTDTALLSPGGATVGLNIPSGTYHTVFALEAGTVIFEAKAGPYAPLVAAEKAPWAPAEGAVEAKDYMERLSRLVVSREADNKAGRQ